MASRRGENEEKICDVEGCKTASVRSISAKKVSDSGISVGKKTGKVHLCKDHYRDFKKKTKKDRELDRAGWN
ncbi:MAG: hypothetical protein ACMUIG_03965 [Thermoplasmatota archaeon]